MANPDAVGRTGSPFPLVVERGKIREFADATFSANPAYRRADAVVPPTFLAVQLHWENWAGPDANPWNHLEIDQERGLHAEQEYVFHGPPPRAGDELTATSRIESVFDKAGRRGGKLTFAVMVTEFRDGAGRLVAEARLTGVETERAPGEGEA